MDHRFGLKDFVVVALLAAIGISLWLSMLQKDRVFEKVRAVESQVTELRARVEQLASEDKGGKALATQIEAQLKAWREEMAKQGPSTPKLPAESSPQASADSWARPGVPIDWQPKRAFTNNPRKEPGFREGGEFTEIWEAQCARVTPYISTDVYARRVIDRVCDQLAGWDPETLALRGVLLDAWQYDPKGLWLRIHLRDGATFSDGAPVTAEDVRFTFQDYILNPLIEATATRSTLDMITDVKVLDPRTVEFTFSKALFTNLSFTLNNWVLPKHFYSRFEPSQINQSTSLLMGSGMYRLASLDPDNQWRPGEDLRLVRNEQYWDRDMRSPLAAMRFRVVSDERSRLAAYRNNEGDMITPTAPQYVATLKEEGWPKSNQSLSWINMRSGYSFIAWQCGKRNGQRMTPFADTRVRQAMTLLLDREAMIKEIWDGVGAVSRGPFNPQGPAADPEGKPWPYDVALAKQKLAEAGWKDRNGDGVIENEHGDPFEFELTLAAGGDIIDRIAAFVKNACLKAGIRCNVRLIDWSIYLDVTKARDFDAIMMGWSPSAPESDVRQMFHSDSIKDAGDNFMQWSNPEADRLLDLGRGTTDTAARMKIWHQLSRVLHEEQPYTFLRLTPWLRFVKKDVANVHPYKTGLEPYEFFRPAAMPGT